MLLKTIQPPTIKPITKPVEASQDLTALLDLVEMRRWKQQTEAGMRGLIEELNQQLKFIAHIKKCGNCLIELELDVERYGGRRGPWYLDLVNDPSSMEEFYEENPHTKGIPRIYDYKIGSYWTGTSEDTVRFIKDRMVWARQVIRRELKAATKYLEILGSWDHRLEEKPEYPLKSSLFYFFWGENFGKTNQRTSVASATCSFESALAMGLWH